jgi:hypothetical protein
MTTIYTEPEIQVSYDHVEDAIEVFIGKSRARIKLSATLALHLQNELSAARSEQAVAKLKKIEIRERDAKTRLRSEYFDPEMDHGA